MKNAMAKDFWREIRNTRSRFFSLLILVALAVAFLSGLRSTAPDMKLTGDEYLDRQGLQDLRLLSTLGFSAEDVESIRQEEHVSAAEGVYTLDAFAAVGDTETVVRVHTLTKQNIGLPDLLEGRMPQTAEEVVVEKKLLSALGISVGDSITLTPGEEQKDALPAKSYTVTGTVRSGWYVSPERGSSSLGSGHTSYYVYLPADAFDLDVFTDVLVQLDGAKDKTAFTEEYDDFVDAAADEMNSFLEQGSKRRYDSVIGEAQEKLSDARSELDEAKAAAEQELSDAAAELQKARRELDDGWKDYREGQEKLADARETLKQAETDLPEAKKSLDEGETEYRQGLDDYEAGKAEYDKGLRDYNRAEAQVRDSRRQLEKQVAQLLAAGQTEMAQVVKAQGEAQLRQAEDQLEQASAQLDEAEEQLKEAGTALSDARKELDDGWKEYQQGLADYQQGQKDVTQAEMDLQEAYDKLQSGEKEYRDGEKEYQSGKREAEEKIADAEETLLDAEDQLRKVEKCTWYAFTRHSNPGYTGFGQDADRMGNLASTFPLIFFLVAALVCLTTMTRMVDEQRIQIGALKALGYSKWAISLKYVGYGLLASAVGGVLGLALGCTLLPKMIYTAYQIMYEMPDIQLKFYPLVGLGSIAAAVFCTVGATVWACYSTLSSTPADLMRPRTPKAGKRVFLEYMTPLWRRMNFIQKVTARNLFRYQKRFWMTVIGIGGCTALIIAAFGLRSSLLLSMDYQYDDLYHYHAQVILDSDASPTRLQQVEDYLAGEEQVRHCTPVYITSVTAESGRRSVSAYFNVISAEDIAQDITLRTRQEHAPLTLTDDGVILTEKLAELLGVSVGDSFTVDQPQRVQLRVAAITEHYIAHFIYLSPAYYQQVFGEAVEYNGYFLTFPDDTKETCENIFSQLLQYNGVLSLSRVEDIRDTYQHSMERVDFVVMIIIVSAGALALVVLFNLSNINISERIRELATIKLLGFYDREVSAYIYRENIVLTIFGIALGMVFGHYLHLYLVRSVEIDLMMFVRETVSSAYVWAAGLTALFSVLVNVVAHYRMKKINMVESLKSAE